MIDQLVDSNVAYSIGGGFVYAMVFALKSVQSGTPFSGTKFGITLVLAGLVGFGFEVVGYDPSAYDWFTILFAFSGMIATLEQSAKLAARGYWDEARDAAGDAVHEGVEAATDLAGDEEVARREVEQHLPSEVRPVSDVDEQHDRAREEVGGYYEHHPEPEDHLEDAEGDSSAEEQATPDGSEDTTDEKENTDGRYDFFDFLRSSASDDADEDDTDNDDEDDEDDTDDADEDDADNDDEEPVIRDGA